MTSKIKNFFWRAPELLRDPNALRQGHRKEMFILLASFLYEIIARSGPFGQIDKTPSEIIKCVMRRDRNPPFRPQVSKLEDAFDCIIDCMQECWAEEPDDRSDFKTIRTKLRPMRKGMKPNIFDNMLAMMEKYANNLEALVDERTDQLIEEKKKTDALLYEMLPRQVFIVFQTLFQVMKRILYKRYVADQLKKGNKVEAESFDCVTIYFSDIVGFTTMSAQSSPLQPFFYSFHGFVTLSDRCALNESQASVDVETIGDAYMVVSGLPIKNGDNHAAEIASMALHLLEAIKKFVIRHRKNDTLMLRIGLHSGAVCAGVVGQKMPRYCLFGDTVNTASRMESTGLPARLLGIHTTKPFTGQKELLPMSWSKLINAGNQKVKCSIFVTPRLVLEGTPSDELETNQQSSSRNYPGWRRMSGFRPLCPVWVLGK
ncbi:receptor-type guanylate cyclase Gyc76C [Caerostris extrusa]|uniref:Receptor-type guanylate cyclase Gyc76C n=1 Tax=Caerostris extrusa TaxID=172846 RepID=A0AAV4VVD7_CAEEX|nr:receptor-type guanylate cyclase Gyc76C [Caerostris extrusa]